MVDTKYYGFNSITVTRLLILTKKQEKIEECIKLEWDQGSCVVCVRELGLCVGNDIGKILKGEEENHETKNNQQLPSTDCEDTSREWVSETQQLSGKEDNRVSDNAFVCVGNDLLVTGNVEERDSSTEGCL
jgi:hypothetical protein